MDFKKAISIAKKLTLYSAAAFALSISLALSGCQSAPPTPLVSNEFDFSNPRPIVKDAIIQTFIGRGYSLVKESDSQLADRPAGDSFAARLIYGSNFRSVPNMRVTLTMTGQNPTHVISQTSIVTNPGTGLEIPHDVSGNPEARAAISRAMDLVKNNISAN